MDKEKKNRIKFASKISIITSLMTIGMLLFIGYYLGNILELETSCKGINNFYSNISFDYDVNEVLAHANLSNQDTIKTPLDLWNGEGVDCKTVSTTIMCLSHLYPDNVECRYYHLLLFDQVGDDEGGPSGHLGIRCRPIRVSMNGTKEYGNWFIKF